MLGMIDVKVVSVVIMMVIMITISGSHLVKHR